MPFLSHTSSLPYTVSPVSVASPPRADALSTAIFQLTQTKFFHQLFHDRITFGVCAGTRFSTDIWRKAIDLELSIIAFEISMTAVAGYLGWKLMSVSFITHSRRHNETTDALCRILLGAILSNSERIEPRRSPIASR